MRRVSAISDSLESARKGKTGGGGGSEKGGERREREDGRRASYGLPERLPAIRQPGQVISFRASVWQIDFVQRRFSHI